MFGPCKMRAHPDAGRIVTIVAKIFGQSPAVICGNSRDPLAYRARYAAAGLMLEVGIKATQAGLALGKRKANAITMMRLRIAQIGNDDQDWLNLYLDARWAFNPALRGLPYFHKQAPMVSLPACKTERRAPPPPDKPVNLPANYARTLELIRRQRGRMSDTALMRSLGVRKWTDWADLVAMAETGVRA